MTGDAPWGGFGRATRAAGIVFLGLGGWAGCTGETAVTTTPTAPTSRPTASASATSAPDAVATTSAAVRAAFSDHFRQVLGPGPGAWESQYVDPGALIAVDGLLHMFYNGIHDWPANASIGHATSSDGITWERQVGDPLMSAIDVPWVGISMFASDAVVLADGTWVIYFHATERINSPAGSSIGIATAPGPAGPWSFGDGPVLEPGPLGSWDDVGVLNPSVVPADGGWLMFYDAQSGDERAWGVRQIGLASSDDGLLWRKSEGPVITAGGDGWRSERVYDPNVVIDQDRFVMTFTTSIDDPNRGVLEFYVGLAMSDDGRRWRIREDPILDVRHRGLGAIFVSSMERLGSDYRLLFDSRAADLTTRIWVLGHDGPLADLAG